MRVSKSKLKKALIEADGNMAAAAKEVGINRQSVAERVRNDPSLAAIVDALKNGEDVTLQELSRSNVAKAILGGCVKTSKWYLERKDPDFRNSVGVRLDDTAIENFVAGVHEEGGTSALRRLVGLN